MEVSGKYLREWFKINLRSFHFIVASHLTASVVVQDFKDAYLKKAKFGLYSAIANYMEENCFHQLKAISATDGEGDSVVSIKKWMEENSESSEKIGAWISTAVKLYRNYA
jgi:hypothetical protein